MLKNIKNLFYFFYNIIWFLNCFFLSKKMKKFSNKGVLDLNLGFFLKKKIIKNINSSFNSFFFLSLNYKNTVNFSNSFNNNKFKYLVNSLLVSNFLNCNGLAVKKWAKFDLEYFSKRDFFFENKT